MSDRHIVSFGDRMIRELGKARAIELCEECKWNKILAYIKGKTKSLNVQKQKG